MNNHIFPVIGHLPVAELKPRHFIDLLKGIEQKVLLEVAGRTWQHMCNIMRHEVHQGVTTAMCLTSLPTGRSIGSANYFPGASHRQLNNTSQSIRLSLYAYK